MNGEHNKIMSNKTMMEDVQKKKIFQWTRIVCVQ